MSAPQPSRTPRVRARQLQAGAIYLGAVLFGTVLLTATSSSFWRAVGVGLWLPGAGFLAAGGWWVLLFVGILALFATSVAAWLHVGAAAAPPLLWLAAALGAGGAAGRHISSGGVQAAIALLLVAVLIAVGLGVERVVRVARLRNRRSGYLPYRLKLVTTTAAATQRDAPPSAELSPDALDGLRLVLDRALQPVGEYAGFDRGSRFSRSGLHEQIAQAGYALAMMQSQYTPNFHGYGTEAQRRLIATSLRRPVWEYWRLQNVWGNLRPGADPLGPGRMEITGSLALQVALYAMHTGDERYLGPGALTCQDGERPRFPHDIHGLAAAIDRDFAERPLCLAPASPDWLDTAVNLRGLAALHLYDRLTGSTLCGRHRERFRTALEQEFFDRDLAFVPQRSARTGMALSTGRPGAAPAMTLDALFPDLATRCWAITREEQFSQRAGELIATPHNAARLDRVHIQTAAFEALLQGAREHGDRDAAAAADDLLGRLARPGTDGEPAQHASGLLTLAVAFDRMLVRAGWRALICAPPAPAALAGPVLDETAYPAVLVAKARSHGTDLELVLYPGAGAGPCELALARLVPGRSYVVASAQSSRTFTAAADGRAVVDSYLDGRTELFVRPA